MFGCLFPLYLKTVIMPGAAVELPFGAFAGFCPEAGEFVGLLMRLSPRRESMEVMQKQ